VGECFRLATHQLGPSSLVLHSHPEGCQTRSADNFTRTEAASSKDSGDRCCQTSYWLMFAGAGFLFAGFFAPHNTALFFVAAAAMAAGGCGLLIWSRVMRTSGK
jgi:Flp pilus assembly protein TadB